MGRATDCSGVLHLGLRGLDLSSIKANASGFAEFRVSPAGQTKAPLPQGPRRTIEEGFYANGEIYNPPLTQTWKSTISFPSD